MSHAQGSESRDPSRAQLFFRRVLPPLARAAVKLGLRLPDFQHLLRESYVAAVADQMPINDSEESEQLLEGLDREEAQALLAGRPAIGEIAFNMPPAADLIYAWFRRPDYGDADGNPLSLPIAGKAPSFQALMEEFCPDQSPDKVLSELISMKTVVEGDDGSIELIGFYNYSNKDFDARIDHAGMACSTFISTAVRKAVYGDESETLYRFGISRSIATEELSEVTEQINDIVLDTQHRVLSLLIEAERRSRGRATTTVGAGAFSFLDDGQELIRGR